jgi:AcrR family transcriptional regulator
MSRAPGKADLDDAVTVETSSTLHGTPGLPVPDDRPRTGRPRDALVHARILASAAALVVRDGYPRVTIAAIAAHAQVGKATIYRRWASKGMLVLEAIASIFSIGAPDTGDTRSDLVGHVRAIGDTVTNSIYGAAIPGLHADLARDPELAEDFRRVCIGPTRSASFAAIERAVLAGDLPADVDFDMLADLFGSLIFFRTLVLGAPIEPDFAEKLISLLLDGEIPKVRPPAEGDHRTGWLLTSISPEYGTG